MLELNRIHCGDNCDLLGKMPRECVELVVTSPPYDDLRTYGGHSWDFFGVAWHLKRVLKPGGVIVWVVADATKDGSETGSSFEQALHFKRLGLNLHDTMIWEKPNPMPQVDGSRFTQAFEYVFVFSARKPAKCFPAKVPTKNAGRLYARGDGNDQNINQRGASLVADERVASNVLSIAVGSDDNRSNHPAVFPYALAEQMVSAWSAPGDLVLDPFSGSGTTAKAAKTLGRQFIGLEVNPEYCRIAEQRIAQEVLALA